MKNEILSIFLSGLMLLNLATPALAAVSQADNASSVVKNTLTNPGAESSTAAFSASGGALTTVSIATAPANVASGNASFSWDSSATGQTVTSAYQTVTSGDGYSGQNGAVSVRVKCATGTCTHKLQAYNGSTVLNEVTINSSTAKFTKATVNFKYPDSGTVAWRLISVASNEPIIYFDDLYRGLSDGFNTLAVNQATFVGSISWVCSSGGWTTAAGGFTSFSATTGCTATLSGAAQQPSSFIPGITFSSLEPGEYFAAVSGGLVKSGSANGSAVFRLYDGTNPLSGTMRQLEDSGEATSSGGFTARTTYTTAQGAITIQLQGKGGTNINAAVEPNSDYPFQISLYRFPTTSQTAVSSNVNPKAPTMQNYCASGCTGGTSATYTLPTNPRPLFLKVRMVGGGGGGGGGGTGGQGAGGSGTASTVGSSFLTANGGAGGAQGNTGGGQPSGGLGGTATIGSGAIGLPLQGGGGQSGMNVIVSTYAGGGMGGMNPFAGAGFSNFTGAGQPGAANSGAGGGGGGTVTGPATSGAGGGAGGWLEALVAGPASTYAISVGTAGSAGGAGASGNAGALGGTGYVEIIEYYSGDMSMPLLIGSVTSAGPGVYHSEFAQISNNGTTPTVIAQSGSWLSCAIGGNIGAVNCTIAAGVFSGPPGCQVSIANSGGNDVIRLSAQPTSTLISTQSISVAASPVVTADGFNVSCSGPR